MLLVHHRLANITQLPCIAMHLLGDTFIHIGYNTGHVDRLPNVIDTDLLMLGLTGLPYRLNRTLKFFSYRFQS